MTVAPPSPPSHARRQVDLGSKGFIAIVSMVMATTALGVDTILPAYGAIRDSLGLEADATEVTGLVTFYLMGAAIGLLPAGVFADRFGRRPVMWVGIAIYVLGAIGTMLAPSLGLMLLARFVWGVGSAGPRVAALAMVRDGFAGEQMARQMSFVMAIFLLVPAFAPTLSVGILAVASWQMVVAVCAVAALVVAALVRMLPETLPAERRRPLTLRETLRGYRVVLATPGTVWYLLSLTAMFGVFMAYLASSELILDQTYDLEEWFPVFFGGTSLAMLVAMVLNGRLVERVGLGRMLRRVFAANVATCVALVVVAVATGGEPPFAVFVVLITAVLFTQQMLIPNVNSAAMLPLAAVAGTGAAVLNMVSGTVGAVVAEVINQRFDGTITPLAVGFVVSSAVAVAAWRRADRVAAPFSGD